MAKVTGVHYIEYIKGGLIDSKCDINIVISPPPRTTLSRLTCSASFHSHSSISVVHACVLSPDFEVVPPLKMSLPPASN